MRAGVNCALANRQILTQLTRGGFRRPPASGPAGPALRRFPQHLQEEEHVVDDERRLFVHRKGATRPSVQGHASLPAELRQARPAGDHRRQHGHRVYILAGGGCRASSAVDHAFASACHGAGRNMSRNQGQQTLAGPGGGGSPGRAHASSSAARPRAAWRRRRQAHYKDITAVVDRRGGRRPGEESGQAGAPGLHQGARSLSA